MIANFYVRFFVLGMTVLYPALIGLLRFKKISPACRPFIYLMWAGFLNEWVSFFLQINGQHNVISNNIFCLVESVLLIWQFNRWKLFLTRPWLYILLSSLLLYWIAELFVFRSFEVDASYFMVYYSFIVTLMSIGMINKLMATEEKKLLKNGIFLACIGIVVYFTYGTLTEIFYIYGLSSNKEFNISVFHIMRFVNAFTNLLFALAILWMPRKQEFSF